MNSPSGAPQVRVELICASLNPPLRREGTVHQVEGRICQLRLDGDSSDRLTPDLGVVLDLQDNSNLHIVGIVRAIEDGNIHVEITRVAHREKRYFPREDGGLSVEYRSVKALENEGPAWLQGLEDAKAQGEAWQRPPPFMNFSGSGLRFSVQQPLEPGSGLLLSFELPRTQKSYRATARVVRCSEHGSAVQAAVEFIDISPEAVQALADFTMERQLEQLAAVSLHAETNTAAPVEP